MKQKLDGIVIVDDTKVNEYTETRINTMKDLLTMESACKSK